MQDYTPEYEEELYKRITEETKNKVRLEKNLLVLSKKSDREGKKTDKVIEAKEKEEEAKEAQRQLDVEFRHQKEEAEKRVMGRAMMTDAINNRPSFNRSCLNLLNSYQGNIIFLHLKILFNNPKFTKIMKITPP